jgi:hypothetical protein
MGLFDRRLSKQTATSTVPCIEREEAIEDTTAPDMKASSYTHL